MPVAAALIRIFAALLLSIPLFFASSYYLVAAAADETVLDAEFLAGTLEKSGLYERIYGEVFLREEFRGWTTSLIGGLEAEELEKQRLLMEVLPPAYVQRETERNVGELTEYLQGQDDDLDLFINLDTPLENARPTAMGHLDQQIQGLGVEEVSGPEQLSEEITTFLTAVAGGRIPDHVPSAEDLRPEQRVEAYRQAIATLAQESSVPDNVLVDLNSQERAISAAVQRGDLLLALRMAGRIVSRPHVEDAIASVRRKTDNAGRLDLIEQLAANSDRTEAQIRKDNRVLRFLVQAGTGPIAQWSALGVALLCLALLGAIFIPYWKHVIIWPSIILVGFGLFLLLTALSAWLDSGYWSVAICNGPVQNSCRLTVDIARNIASGVAAVFTHTALKVIVIGLAGVVASLVAARIAVWRAR